MLLTVFVLICVLSVIGCDQAQNSKQANNNNDIVNSGDAPKEIPEQIENNEVGQGISSPRKNDACTGLSNGDSCNFIIDGQTIEGICTPKRDKLNCMPQNMDKVPKKMPQPGE